MCPEILTHLISGSRRTINVTSSRVVRIIPGRADVPSWNLRGLDGDIHQKVEAALFESCEPSAVFRHQIDLKKCLIYQLAYVYTYADPYGTPDGIGMPNRLPLEYGPREAEILRSLSETHRLPSKNEGFRRGIVAVDYLMDADRGILFAILGTLLRQASEGSKDMISFPEKLEACKTLACEIVATFAVQKGIESADSIDIFRSDLDNYLVLAKTEGLKGADKDELAKRLSVLSDMAYQFAKKESDSSGKSPKTASTGSKEPVVVSYG